MKKLIQCDVCGKHYANLRYLSGEESWIYPSHYDFGTCSVECWSEHINLHDENLADRFTSENIEMAEYLAEEMKAFFEE